MFYAPFRKGSLNYLLKLQGLYPKIGRIMHWKCLYEFLEKFAQLGQLTQQHIILIILR